MAPIVLKFKLGRDIRRLSVDQPLTYSNVVSVVSQLFPSLSGYTLKYEDPDGDKITVSSEQEIREAVSVALTSGGVLRFIVFDKQEKEIRSDSPISTEQTQPPQTTSSSTSSPSVHEGVTCDGCQMSPIIGTRYKCVVCHDFDLCSNCESTKTHDPSHPLIKHVQPFLLQQHCRRRFHHEGMGGRMGRYHHHHHHHQNNNNENSDSPSTPPGFGFRHNPAEFNPQKFFCGMKKGRHHLARFVSDVTIEDGTILKAGENFQKVWRMRNTGENEWTEGTTLTFVGGDKLSVVEQVPITKTVAPSEEIDISVEMTTPQQPGRYTSYWRLVNSEGRFGQRVWVDIRVEGNNTSPQPQQQDSPIIPTAPVIESSVPTIPLYPVAEILQPTTPIQVPVVVVEEKLSESEVKSLEVLKEMGFTGNLLEVLRKHKGDLVATIRDLCGH